MVGKDQEKGIAVLIDSLGQFRWSYVAEQKSVFWETVPLVNGNYLICGGRMDSPGNWTNLLLFLNSDGKVIDQRVELPDSERSLTHGSFSHCMPWDGGIAVIGRARNEAQSLPWLLKLDSSGKRLWDRVLEKETPTTQVLETADHGLIFSAFNSGSREMTVFKTDKRGNVTARKALNTFGAILLRTVSPMDTIWAIGYGIGDDATLFSWNENLEDVQQPVRIDRFDAQDCCGYVTADKSIVLFGRTSNAALAVMSMSGHIEAAFTFSLELPSFAVADAVPVSSDQFLAVRNSVSTDPGKNGLTISWLSFSRNP